MSAAVTQRPAPNSSASGAGPKKPRTHHLYARSLAAAALSLALLAGLASLSGVVQGGAWFGALIWPVVFIHGSAGVLRCIRGWHWAALPVALLVAVGAVLGHQTMRANPPSMRLIDWFGALASEAAIQFSTQVPPVAYSRYVEFVLLLLAVVLSLVVEVLASFKRLAPLVIMPLCFAPVIASLFKQEGAGIGYLVLMTLAILGYFALLPYIFRSEPTGAGLPAKRQVGILAVTAAACALAMILSGLFMPGFRNGMLPEGTRPSGDLLASNVDPLLNLGRDLRANNGSVAFSYLTSSAEPVYLRTSIIEDLSATRWEPSEDLLQSAYFGDTAMDTDADIFNGTPELTQLTWDGQVSSPSLPLPDRSFYITGINGSWNWTKQTSVARLSGDAMAETGQVTVGHTQMNLSAEMARNLGYFGGELTNEIANVNLSMPEDLDGEFDQLLRQTLAEAYGAQGPPANDFDKAVAIQDFLRSASFGYSERTPLREGYDGANRQVIKAFLDRRQGYCVHFASTMTLLARASGIPSRIVVGYAPGEPTGETFNAADLAEGNGIGRNVPPEVEFTEYEVTGQQAHAWPELFLPGIGWVPFEPTPGQGQAPDYAPGATPNETPQEVPEELNPSGAPELDDPEAEEGATANAPQQNTVQAEDYGWMIVLGVLVIALLLAVFPWKRARLRRRRIEQVLAGGAESAQALWDELRALGADVGSPAGEQESVSDYTLRLAENHQQLAAPLSRLREGIQASFYAHRHPDGVQGAELAAALEQLAAQLGRELHGTQRVLRFCFPASLRERQLREASGFTNAQ
ncbi:transglutaminase family protein [Glutamicibacter sp. AOP12-B1-11]|uniref:transglutaminase family protein n=1 Tax=Glutamicibacter sp. AOP12-B1-11 TaxID=3457725 RepID=UPI004033D0F6